MLSVLSSTLTYHNFDCLPHYKSANSVALDRAFRADLTLEFSEADRAISVVIKLLQHLGSFLRGNVEATAFDDSFDFVCMHQTIRVQVKTVEGLVSIKVGAAC